MGGRSAPRLLPEECAGDAGSITLERGEKPATVKRMLQEAARRANVRIRSSWTDDRQRVLVWKRVGTR